jgi:hypothetical protein
MMAMASARTSHGKVCKGSLSAVASIETAASGRALARAPAMQVVNAGVVTDLAVGPVEVTPSI